MKESFFFILFIFHGIVTAQNSNISTNDSISIHYNIGKYILTTQNKQIIDSFLKNIDTTITYKVKIISSADYIGTPKNNFILAANRAHEIKQALNNKFAQLFTTIETVNKGEISEIEKEKEFRLKGNLKNRKTTIVFIKNSVVKKKIKKKVYIYNPVKKEFDLRVGNKFTLKKLIFYRGTTNMYQKSKSSLSALLRFLKENPTVEIEIQGHLCCDSENYQADKSKVKPYPERHLSTKRARLVYKYLVIKGIRKKRLTYHGYGFQLPLFYPEKEDKDKRLNKRVEIVITNF